MATTLKPARAVHGMNKNRQPQDEHKAPRPTASSHARRLKPLEEQAAAIGIHVLPAAS